MIAKDDVDGHFEGNGRRQEATEGEGRREDRLGVGCFRGRQFYGQELEHGRAEGEEAYFSGNVDAQTEAHKGDFCFSVGDGRCAF